MTSTSARLACGGSCVGGVVTVEHPPFGRLDFDDDNYTATRVTHDWREGFYADALFSAETSNDDAEFERAIGAELGTDAVQLVPVYDRHAAYRFDPTDPTRPEILTPSEIAALGADEPPDFDSADSIAAAWCHAAPKTPTTVLRIVELISSDPPRYRETCWALYTSTRRRALTLTSSSQHCARNSGSSVSAAKKLVGIS